MRSRLVIRMMSLIPVIVSAAGLDPAYDESLFFGSSMLLDLDLDLDLDQTASPSLLDLAVLPEDTEAGASELLPGDENDDGFWLSPSSEIAAATDSPELADCSASGYLPPLGRSRVKRLDVPNRCGLPTPAVATHSTPQPRGIPT